MRVDITPKAPVNAKYIVQQADGILTDEQALGALATGIMKVTTITGAVSTATEGTDYYKPSGTDVAVADGGSGASTAAAAALNLSVIPNDGWIQANETWTYASASTFTVSGDVTAKYQIGTLLKFTQTTVKYAVVTAVSYGAPNTTVTIAVNTDYTIANAAITLNYYSYMVNPQGWPTAFVFSVSVTGFSVDPTGMLGSYSVVGRMVTVTVYMPNTGTSNATSFTISSLPFTCATIGTGMSIVGTNTGGNDNGAYQTNTHCKIGSGASAIALDAAGGSLNWTASGAKNVVYTTITYPF